MAYPFLLGNVHRSACHWLTRQLRSQIILLVGNAVVRARRLLVVLRNSVWSRAGRRAFSGRPELAQDYTVDADESGIVFSGAISRMQWSWAAFIKFAESEKLFLIYLSPCAFVILPKRILSPDESDHFRELLRQKLPAS
jgi:hypothetical protein